MTSGDNRDYCEVTHEVPGSDLQANTVREVTVKSFSPSRHIRRPGLQLLSLIPPSSSPTGPTFADAPCRLPDTLHVFHSIYVPCFILTALVLLYLNISRFSNLSHISSARYRRSSSSSEPESAIWATRTPLKPRIQTNPTAPFPPSARIPSTKSIPSYRAFPITTPRSSPLLSPITLWPSGDEGDAEEDHIGTSHYTLRRDPPCSGGWHGEHDEVARDRDTVLEGPHPRPAAVPYFLPPPFQHARARWLFSWSFVFWGRRRRVGVGVPDWKAWRSWLGASTGHRKGKGRGRGRERGLVWRFASDCVSVALPAVVAWTMVSWLFF